MSKNTTDCDVKQVTIETPICLLKISACNHGLHSIERLDRGSGKDKTFNFDEIMKIIANDNKNKSDYPQSMIFAIEWFEKYFQHDQNTNDIDRQEQQKIIYDKLLNSKLLCSKIKLSNFAEKSYLELLKTVKYGQTKSYGDLSESMAGNRKNSRAIGSMMKSNPLMIMIPCHRLIHQSGVTGKYGGEQNSIKKWLIDFEKSSLKKKI